MRPALTAPALLRCRLVTRPAAAVLFAVLILATACAGALTPRLIDRQATAEVADRLGALGPVARSIQGSAEFPETWPTDPPPTEEQIFGDLDGAVGAIRGRLPQPLRSGVGAATWLAETPATPVDGAARPLAVQLVADREYAHRTRIVTGRGPATWTGNDTDADPSRDAPVDILISVDAARRLDLRVGSILAGSGADGPAPRYRVRGLFAPADAADEYWLQHPELRRPMPVRTRDQVDRLSIGAYVAPVSVGRLSATFRAARVALVLPVSADAWSEEQATAVESQVAGLVSTGIPLPGTDAASLSTGTGDALASALQRTRMFTGLIALLASAPAGVLLAVLAVASGAVLRPWRHDLELAAARGGGGRQLRVVLIATGAVIGVPGAALGLLVAVLSTPGAVTPGDVVVPLAAAALPAVLLAAALPSRGSHRVLHTLRRFAGVGTVALALLALLALATLVVRGVATSALAVGIDPLLVATPLLLALATAVVALRAVPLLVRIAAVAARRGRGAVAVVGTARASRAPTAGAGAVLALIVGISTALFSATMLSTLDRAVVAAARAAVGADARVDGELGTARVDAIRNLSGVRAAAGIEHLASAPVHGPHVLNDTVSLLLADTAPLRSLHPSVPAGLAKAAGRAVPIAVSADLRRELPVGGSARLDGVLVRVVGAVPSDAGLGPRRSWVLVDARFAARFSGAFRPDLLLVRADPGAPDLRSALRRAAGPDAAVTTTASELADRRGEPVVVGARVALVAGSALPALLAAIAIVLSVLAAAAPRRRTAGILQSLGMPRRRVRALVAWELVPPGVVALAAGSGVGALLSAVLAASIDLTPFVGAASAPTAPPPLVTAAIVGGFAAIAALAGVGAVVAGRGRHPARAVKMGAE